MDSSLAPTGTKCRALWMAGKGIVDMPEDVALKIYFGIKVLLVN